MPFAGGAWEHEREDYGEAENDTDKRQRDSDRKFASKPMIQPHHLESYKNQHHGQAVFQQMKLFDRAAQHEVERPESEDGENIRGEDNEWLPG